MAPANYVTLCDLSFQPFSHPPDIQPYSHKQLTKILIKKIINRIESCEFKNSNGSSRVCGGNASGAVLPHFMVSAEDYIVQVYFRQFNHVLLGILFQTKQGVVSVIMLLLLCNNNS